MYFSNADLKINTNAGNGSIGDSDTSFGYHILGGIDCNISENIAIGVDAKWFNTTANYSNKGVSFNDYNIGGTVVRLGLKYRMW